MVSDGEDATYVIDALGEALLVYRRSPFQLIRRVHLGRRTVCDRLRS